jgi:ribA/ribD-fused uncharacterized protein
MTPKELKKMWKSIKKEQKVIGFYSNTRGEHKSFSNFYSGHPPFYYKIPEECGIHSGEIYTISYSEKAIMLCKASLMGDNKIFEEILNTTNPVFTKRLGRLVSPFNEELWQKNVCRIAKDVILHKFDSSEILKELLLSTDDNLLAEATPRDKIWGIGMSQNDTNITYPCKWKGSNVLGWALMKARKNLRDV